MVRFINYLFTFLYDEAWYTVKVAGVRSVDMIKKDVKNTKFLTT